MGVAPAGTKRANSGHHHLLVDADLPPLDKPIPNDENHLHFGGGQTETELSLSPDLIRCNCCSATPTTSPIRRRSTPKRFM